MKIIVTGATGNLGSAIVRELSHHGHEVTGVARRAPTVPARSAGSVSWREADLSTDDLAFVASADAVVHLAWRFQPTHHPEVTWMTNAVGTRRLLRSAVDLGTSTIVCVSSVAAYSPGPAGDVDTPVDEAWPTDGASSAAYCREKAYVERCLDACEAHQHGSRVVRLRPAFVFQRSAANEQRRIFGGPLARPSFLRRGRLPLLPVPAGLRFQAVHADDVGRAVAAAIEHPVHGPVNLAAHGIVRREDLGRILDTHTAEVRSGLLRTPLAAAFSAGLAPVPPELYDAFLRLPIMSTAKAESELKWRAEYSAADAVAAFFSGVELGAGSDLPPLHP